MKLFYFTNSYPYDDGTFWKQYELHTFKKYFEITVIPALNFGLNNKHTLIDGVKYEKPLVEANSAVKVRTMLLTVLTSTYRTIFIKDLILSAGFRKKVNVIKWIRESYDAVCFMKHPVIKKLINNSDEKTIWYFFWARNAATIIPFLHKKKCKIACRFHGYDLYLERNHGYIPLQKNIVFSSDILLPCSSHGKNYLEALFPKIRGTFHVARLGCKFVGTSEFKPGRALRIVSCSSILPVKRLKLLIEALSVVKINVEWNHIGGGDDKNEIKLFANKKLKEHVSFKFVGLLFPEEVQPFYLAHNFDLFINVSESEGVPVSIMEALATGMPVYATNVGGTGEIVDSSVGKLLPSNISAEELARELEDFFYLETERKKMLRVNATSRFHQLCDVDMNAEKLANFLLENIGNDCNR